MNKFRRIINKFKNNLLVEDEAGNSKTYSEALSIGYKIIKPLDLKKKNYFFYFVIILS